MPESNNPGARPQERRRRLVSIRASLLVSFGLVLAVVALGIGYNNLRVGQRVMNSLRSSLIDKTTVLTETKLESFFRPAAGLCSSLALLTQAGLLNTASPEAIVRFTEPLLQSLPAVSSFNLGDATGWGIMVKPSATNWLTREVDPARWPGEVRWTRWTADGRQLDDWTETLDYDPRLRPWYTNAIAALEAGAAATNAPAIPNVTWSEPYAFLSSGEAGVTASIAVPLPKGNHLAIACDVLIRDLDRFTAENPPTPGGWTVVVNDRDQILGWPGRGGYSREQLGLSVKNQRLLEIPISNMVHVARSWIEGGRPSNYVTDVRALGETFWFSARPMQIGGSRFWTLMAVPESELLADVLRERKTLFIVIAGALLIAAVLAFWLASSYSRPLQALVRRSEQIESLELGPGPRVRSNLAELDRLYRAQEQMRRAIESFSRYVPVDVIRELLRRGEAARIGARPAELTVMFSDIRGFTGISEMLAPDELARLLADYFDALQQVIERGRGTTDKFIGDAILAFWGAPNPDAEHALHATLTVLECRDTLVRLNREWRAAGRPELPTCFGLATGPVVVGNVGAHNRLNYTVLGNTVNVASRLQGLCRNLGCDILATQEVVEAAGNSLLWRRVGPVVVRGKRHTVEVFEPLGTTETAAPSDLDFRRSYESALAAFLRRDFTLAVAGLQPWLSPPHPAAEVLVRRCRELQAVDPTPDDLVLAGANAALHTPKK